MPRTKSTAGSQTYLKESWQINCTNRLVTDSHASMFAGNGSWSMRQVTRCSFLAACAAWKLLVHVERYSPESPKISCRLVDLLLKTSWQRKTSPKKRQWSRSICQAAAVPQPMPAILPNVVTSTMQMADQSDKRPWFWSRACVVERGNKVEVVVVEVEVEVVVVWLPMLPQPKKTSLIIMHKCCFMLKNYASPRRPYKRSKFQKQDTRLPKIVMQVAGCGSGSWGRSRGRSVENFVRTAGQNGTQTWRHI